MNNIQIFGPFCSGTNLITKILKQNINEPLNIQWEGHTHIWKHTIRLPYLVKCIKNNKDTLFICMFKPLYEWVASIRKKQYGIKWDKHIKHPCILRKIKWKTIIHLYNSYYSNYKYLIEKYDNVIFIDYYNLLDNATVKTYIKNKLAPFPLTIKSDDNINSILNNPAKKHGKSVKNAKEALLKKQLINKKLKNTNEKKFMDKLKNNSIIEYFTKQTEGSATPIIVKKEDADQEDSETIHAVSGDSDDITQELMINTDLNDNIEEEYEEEQGKDIIKQVKILKNNSDYAFGDIVYRKGKRWKYRIQKVLTDPKYKNTILFNYLKLNKNNNCNYNILLNCIKEYNCKNNLLLPSNNEIVIHLRMGDVVTCKRFLKNNYVSAIEKIIKNNTINKITIVTCFSYGVWTEDSLHLRKGAPMWNYTIKKQKKNEQLFSELLSKFQTHFNIPIHIYSNKDIDKDFCYCVFSRFYINDHGGFDRLTEKLNQLYLKQNTIDLELM